MKVHSSRDIPEHTKDFQMRNPRFDLLDHNSLCEISNDSHKFSSLKKFQSKDEIEEIETNKSCSLCKTQKTPLWRNGPNGPKSLCNACGIRYKKLGKKPDQDSLKRIRQKRKQNMELRNTDRDVKKIFQRNFTKDEEEGAFLLIGLSCGLVNA